MCREVGLRVTMHVCGMCMLALVTLVKVVKQ